MGVNGNESAAVLQHWILFQQYIIEFLDANLRLIMLFYDIWVPFAIQWESAKAAERHFYNIEYSISNLQLVALIGACNWSHS